MSGYHFFAVERLPEVIVKKKNNRFSAIGCALFERWRNILIQGENESRIRSNRLNVMIVRLVTNGR